MNVTWVDRLALQAVAENLAEGYLMPFGVRNRHGYMAMARTEFGLDMFPVKPVFHLHTLRGDYSRHGEIVDIERRARGLFGRAAIDSVAYEFLSSHRAGWSTGSMPHLVELDDDGVYKRWVICEVSYGEEHELANQPGSTSAVLQSLVDFPVPECVIERGIIVMPPENVVSVVPPVAAPAVAEPAVAAPAAVVGPSIDVLLGPVLQSVAVRLDAIDSRLSGLEDAPSRALPVVLEPVVREQPAPRISVSSRWDHRSILGMVFEDELRASVAHADKQRPHLRSNEWWRALVDKMARHYQAEPHRDPEVVLRLSEDEKIFDVPDNLLFQQSYEAFNKMVPYLQADEAMKSDFTSYGLELVPTLFSNIMYHFARAESVVFQLFEVFQPTSYPSFKWPTITSGPTWRRVKEASDQVQMSLANSPIPSSKIGTGNVEFKAGGIGAMTLYTEQLLKASAPDLMEAAALEYVRSSAEEIDWVLMNGDETAAATNISHLADPTNSNWDKALAIDGLRHLSIIDNTTDAAAEATIAITTPAVGAAKMGTRGLLGDDIPNVVMIAAPESARKFYALTAFQSIADVGLANSTLLHGQVGVIAGYRLVKTPVIELADANGKYEATHASGTVGQIVFVHRPTIKVALFQPPRFNSEFVAHARTFAIHSTVELDLKQMEIGGTACLFNNTV